MKALWIISLALLSGCATQSNPLSPVTERETTRAQQVAPEDWRPTLKHVAAHVAGPFLIFHGVLDDNAPVPFGPDWAGSEWSFICLLNTDQDLATGLRGYEYSVRGISQLPDGSLAVHVAQGNDWGEVVCAARFILSDRQFRFSIPLRDLNDDGALDWLWVSNHAGNLSERSGSTTGGRLASLR